MNLADIEFRYMGQLISNMDDVNAFGDFIRQVPNLLILDIIDCPMLQDTTSFFFIKIAEIDSLKANLKELILRGSVNFSKMDEGDDEGMLNALLVICKEFRVLTKFDISS